MVAAPFKAVLKFACADGHTFSHSCTVSDVNGEFYVFQSGETTVTLPGNHGVVSLVDVILSAAGTDTSTGTVYINSRATPELLMNSACLGTNLSRQLMGVPIHFAPAATLRVTQNT